MCLVVLKGTSEQTATQDIEVFKLLTHDNRSIVLKHPYFANDTKISSLRLNAADSTRTVDIGLHSYASIEASIRRGGYSIFLGPRDCKLVRMKIPTGAHYYIGENGEYASDILRTGDLAAMDINPYLLRRYDEITREHGTV